ncbi:hypothetical protein F5Y15DRAFT_356568 [Xylariaceae sp. FL0016]|nr:hypothetical protein F5Y15DRAFT_356568 [Xylariaceae sp. FL0016]
MECHLAPPWRSLSFAVRRKCRPGLGLLRCVKILLLCIACSLADPSVRLVPSVRLMPCLAASCCPISWHDGDGIRPTYARPHWTNALHAGQRPARNADILVNRAVWRWNLGSGHHTRCFTKSLIIISILVLFHTPKRSCKFEHELRKSDTGKAA